MTDDQLPATWIGGQAVVQFPESADALTAGQARELMLRLMNQGAAALIADMTSTVWCDRSIADALLSAYHRFGRRHRVGVRRHGSTFPVRISVRLAAAGTSRFTLAVVQDITYAHPLPSRGDRASAAALSGQAHSIVLTLDRAVSRLFSAGLGLQSAISRPRDQARYLIGDAVGDLDAVIGDIRRLVFSIERRSGARSRDSRNRYGLLLVRRAVRTCGAPSSISPPPLRRAGAGMTARRRHRGPCRRDQGPPGAGPWSLAVTRQDVVNW